MNELNILIVEDESLVALELSISIKNYGYKDVHYATTIEKAQKIMHSEEINLVLMDINLGNKLDGVDLYKSFNTDISIIYLTAYQDESTISKAVETEPLGYLIKPYNENELVALLKLATLKIVNNKPKLKKTPFLVLGEGYFFNTEEDKLFFQKTYIKLSQKELSLLKLLIEQKGQILSFKSMEYEIWKDSVPSSSSIRTLIYRLRKKLNHKLIETEFDQGIKLKLDS